MTGSAAAPDVTGEVTTAATASAENPGAVASEAARPISAAALQLRERREWWKKKVVLLLIKSHLSRQLKAGREGAVAIASFVYLSLRVGVGALRQALLRGARSLLASSRRGGADGPAGSAAPAA